MLSIPGLLIQRPFLGRISKIILVGQQTPLLDGQRALNWKESLASFANRCGAADVESKRTVRC